MKKNRIADDDDEERDENPSGWFFRLIPLIFHSTKICSSSITGIHTYVPSSMKAREWENFSADDYDYDDDDASGVSDAKKIPHF